MAAHARLKTEFTEVEKYHNLMRWLSLLFFVFMRFLFVLGEGWRSFIGFFHGFVCSRSNVGQLPENKNCNAFEPDWSGHLLREKVYPDRFHSLAQNTIGISRKKTLDA